MAAERPASHPRSADLDDRLIFTTSTDDDDASRDPRRAVDADRAGGQAADNSYLQSAHQGGFDVGGDQGASAAEDPAEEDGVAYAGEERDGPALGSAGDGSFVYDAGALFPDLDMSGPASFEVDGPAWLAVDPATGLLTGVPGDGDVGVHAFTVTATDAAGERFTTTLEFVVEAEGGESVVSHVLVLAPAEGASTDVPAEEAASGVPADADAPAESAPSQDAPASEQPAESPVVATVSEEAGENAAPAAADEQTPVQDSEPSLAEPPVADQPATDEPVLEAEQPVAEQPPVEEPPVEEPGVPAEPEEPVLEAEPPVPEPPAAEEPVAPPVESAPPEPPKTYNVIDGTKKADFIVGTDGADQITGGRGADKMQGGAGDDLYIYNADKNGADVFDDGKDGDGYDVAVATEANVVIGVDGYNDGRTFSSKGVKITSTGVDEFQGAGDTIIRDGGSSRTLDFSHTKLGGILEVDAGGGADKVIASDLSDASYRGGAGNDTLTAGQADATWLYSGAKNGSDAFVNGEGHSVALAQGQGVVIGVNGYANGVDAFEGQGDTIVRDSNSSRTLDFSNTGLNGVLEVDAAGGNDTLIASDLSDASYRGGAGNDALTAGKADATWLYSGAKNGSDTFVNGEGDSVALAQGQGVVIGVNGYENGVDAFEGQGDTVVRDSNSSRTLDFSNTELNGVLEVDAAGGNDTLIASDLSDASYRGGAGNDTLTAGAKGATWLYGSGDNGFDTLTHGAGHAVAQAEGEGVVIGVNGYADGVDAFEGQGDTVVRDSNSSHTLDFSNTELNGVLEVDAAGGNDTLIASNLSDASYRGGAGNDTLTAGAKGTTWLYGAGDNGFDSLANGSGVSIAKAEGAGVAFGVNGYQNGVDGFLGAGDTVIRDSNSSHTLDFSNTAFKGVLEVDAGGGNDTVVASNLSEGAYRGGAGNDSLTAGDQRTVWVYGSGDNGYDSFTNGAGDSLAQAEDAGVVIGVNGYANGVDGFLGAGDTVIRDGASSRTLDFSNTALKGIAEVDAGGGNDTITVSNLSDGVYQGGAGNDVFVVQKGAASAVIADFDDAGNDRVDLSAFGSSRADIQSATSLVDADGDGQVDDVQIDLGALGGEKGATLSLLDTDLKALSFSGKSDFVVAGDSGAKFAKGQELMAVEGDVDQLFTFDMDTLDRTSGWTAALDGPASPDAGADAFLSADGGSSGVIVFEDGSDTVHSSITDSQWG